MIDSSVIKQIYVGDGETTHFPFPFPFADVDDVKVSLYDIETGAETQLESDYFVDANASTVIYPGYPPGEEPPESEQPPILPSSQKIIIFRETPVTQTEDLGKKHPLPIIEGMSDKATMIMQEFLEKIGRAVLVKMGSDVLPDDLMQELENDVTAAAASAAAAAISEANAKNSKDAAHLSEVNADASADAAEAALEEAKEIAKVVGVAGEPYDPTKTYNLPDIVVLPDGSTWRCLSTSTGEYPATSSKWTAITMAQGETFEYDADGNLQPRAYAQSSSMWQIDDDENIMPTEVETA